MLLGEKWSTDPRFDPFGWCESLKSLALGNLRRAKVLKAFPWHLSGMVHWAISTWSHLTMPRPSTAYNSSSHGQSKSSRSSDCPLRLWRYSLVLSKRVERLVVQSLPMAQMFLKGEIDMIPRRGRSGSDSEVFFFPNDLWTVWLTCLSKACLVKISHFFSNASTFFFWSKPLWGALWIKDLIELSTSNWLGSPLPLR